MKSSRITPALVVAALCAGLAAGQTPQSSGSEYAAQAGNDPANTQASAQVPAELSKTLDSKNAKVSEEIVAKSVKETRLADGTMLPKGAKLMGHVTAVQPRTKDNPNGQVTIVFDHAVTKDGHQMPLRTALLGIREAPHAAPPPMSDGGGMGNPGMGGPGMSGPTMAGGPSQSGRGGMGAPGANTSGGMQGGGNNGSMGGPSSGPVNMPPNGGNPPGSASAPMAGVGDLPGVSWSNVSASGEAVDPGASAGSGVTFRGEGRNVTLEGGTQMILLVMPPQAAPQPSAPQQ